MIYRALIDRKGEPFAYLLGDGLYTLEDEPSGRIKGQFIVDKAGNPVWRIVGDGIYALDGMESIGYLAAPRHLTIED